MVYFIKLAINDLKNIFRDRFLAYASIILPLALIIICRLVFPWIAEKTPWIEGFYTMFFMMFLIMIPMVFGFITAFLIMDERDEDLLTVLRVMPISRNSYLLYRMFFMSVFSFIYVLIFPYLSGLLEGTQFSYVQYIPVALLLALFTPIIALMGTVLANNKVQAFAIFKISGTIFFLPLFAFSISGNLRYVFGVIPNFWTFMSLDSIISFGNLDYFYLIIGFAFHIGLLCILFYIFNRKY